MELFERPAGGERALLVHVLRGNEADQEDLDEFIELARSAGADVRGVVSASRQIPDPRYFVGSGKAEEVRDAVAAGEIELVIVNHTLSPSQERNLERLLQCRVLDRTGLILDIFAQRARSHEGKLQVELAQLRHLSTRLVRGWTHLERQRGGSIGLRGPGETQLELDRRLIAGRIQQLQRRIDKVHQQRLESRKGRDRAEVPTVSLVGYTNAGKSTLFNRLTAADVYAADQLFATLDTTLRRGRLPCGRDVVYADTVGFIRHLPHELVTAFRSTLEEARDAGLLLHVIDAAGPERERCIADVEAVLTDIGALSVPRLDVYNKIDLLADCPVRVDRDAEGRPVRVWVSARTGAGIALLIDAIRERVEPSMQEGHLRLSASEGRLRAKLFAEGAVVAEEMDEEGGWRLHLRLPRVRLEQLASSEPALKELLKD